MHYFNFKVFFISLLILINTISADIGGYVYQDKANGVYGVRETGEPGVDCANIRITDTNGNSEIVSTDNNGDWTSSLNAPARVELLNIENCNLQEGAFGSNGHTDVQFVEVNSNNIQFSTYYFKDAGLGDKTPIEVGNLIWKDDNKNGIQDAGENGISGVELKLICDAGVVSTATTGNNGYYIFSTDKTKTSTDNYRYDEEINENLVAGNLNHCSIVIENQSSLSNLQLTKYKEGTNDKIDSNGVVENGKIVISIPNYIDAGDNDHSLDVGFIDDNSVSLGDYVWNDTNKNGIQDIGENGIGGVTVNLLDETGNIVQSTITDTDGNYQFSGLINGDKYYIEFIKPSATNDFTQQNQGNDDGKDSDVDTTGKTALITVGSSDDLTIDCGIIENTTPETACLGDYVWQDDNKNGIQELGESGISGVSVNLLDTNGNIVNTTTTNSVGAYKFCGLNNGDSYYIEFIKPSATNDFTQQNQGNDDSKDSDVDTTGKTALITVGSSDDLTIDCGIIENTHGGSSISLTKKFTSIDNVNNNGVIGDEGDIIHYELIVTNIGQLALDNVTVTDNNANISNGSVGHLNVGESKTLTATHTITQNDVMAGKVINQAIATGVDSNGDTVMDKSDDPNDPTDLDPNNDGNPDDPTVVPLPHIDGTYCIGDTFWYDKNLNGIQDASDKNIRNMIVELYDANKTKLATTKTDQLGKYKFCNLTAGTYYVKFILPSGGYLFTSKSKGSDGTIDSDANEQTGWSDAIVLEDDIMDIDAGIYCGCDKENPSKHKKFQLPFSSFGVVIFALLLIRFSFQSKKIGV